MPEAMQEDRVRGRGRGGGQNRSDESAGTDGRRVECKDKSVT